MRQSRTAPPKTGHFLRCAPRKNNRARHHILVTHNSTNLICSKWRIIIMATFLTIFPSHFFPPSTVFPHLTTDGQCLHFFVVLLTFSYPFFPSLLCCPFHPYVVVIFSIISPPVPSFHSHFFTLLLSLFFPSSLLLFYHFIVNIFTNHLLLFTSLYFHLVLYSSSLSASLFSSSSSLIKSTNATGSASSSSSLFRFRFPFFAWLGDCRIPYCSTG